MVLFGRSRRAEPVRGGVRPETEALAAQVLEHRRGRKPVQPPPSMARHANPVLAPILAKAGVGIGELKRRWPEIVGEKLAKATEPEKISSGVLTIKAPGAVSPFVQHQQGLILERCRLAGAKVKSLAIRQGALAPLGSSAKVQKLRPDLSAEAAAALEQELAGVAHPGLKAALSRLGRAVRRG